VDHSEYALWSPGKFQREVTHAAAQRRQISTARRRAGAHDAVHEMQAAFESSAGPAEQAVDKFGRDQGVRLIPREVYHEIHATIKGRPPAAGWSTSSRGSSRRSCSARTRRGCRMQVGANAFLAAFGTRGNVADFIKAPLFYRTFDKPTKEALTT
jgi:hypothetical protein